MQFNRLISFFYIGLSPCVEKSLSPSGPTSPSGAASHDIVPHPDRKPRQRHVHSADYYISNAPAESRSAGCGARRKVVRLSGRRHGVAPWASVKLPLQPACPSKAQQAQAFPQASQPSLRPRCRYPQRGCSWGSTSWSKVRQAQAFPRAYPSKARRAQAYPEASRPSLRPRCRYPQRVCPWGSTSWSKAQQAQAYPRECPSKEAQARACPEASRPSLRPRSPSKARVLPA